jgi:hypothetical protein
MYRRSFAGRHEILARDGNSARARAQPNRLRRDLFFYGSVLVPGLAWWFQSPAQARVVL